MIALGYALLLGIVIGVVMLKIVYENNHSVRNKKQ